MRFAIVPALVVLAATGSPAIAATEGTVTACLTKNGSIRAAKNGIEAARPCRKRQIETHLQDGKVGRFNFDLTSDHDTIYPDNVALLLHEEGLQVLAECPGGPEIIAFFDDRFLVSIQTINDITSHEFLVIEDTGDDSIRLLSHGSMVWSEMTFTPYDGDDYIAKVRFFAVDSTQEGEADSSSRCRFKGEAEVVRLPKHETVDGSMEVFPAKDR